MPCRRPTRRANWSPRSTDRYAALTPEQLDALRRQLPAFDSGAERPALLDTLCEFYSIDFHARMPGVSHECGTLPSGDYTLAVHRWLVPKARANLLLMHGYFDHTGLFNKMIGWALAHGCNVLMFDLPGHGLSSGEPAAIEDFAQYSLAMDNALSNVDMPSLPWWAMGQSTGCAAITDYARRYDWPFAGAVLLAPLVRPRAWGLVKLGHTVAGPFRDSVPRTFTDNSPDTAFLKFIREDPLQAHATSLRWVGALRRWLRGLKLADLGVGPVFVVQGDDDGTVDWRYNLTAIDKLYPGTHILMLEGAGHQLANESVAYREQYLAAVRAYLAHQGILLPAD